MLIYIKDKEIDFNKDDYEFIESGREGEVYHIGKDAVKIYHDFPSKAFLDKDTVKYYKKIKTNRILLPRKMVYDSDYKMIGYTTPYKKNYNQTVNLITGQKLNEDLHLLKEDTNILTNANVLIEDLHRDNMVYDGSIYLVDPGSYIVNRYHDIRTSKYNLEAVNSFVIDELFDYELKQITSLKKARYIRDRLKMESEDDFVCDVIQDDLVKSKNLKSYVKSLVKRV